MTKITTRQANYRLPVPLLQELKSVSEMSVELSQTDIVRDAIKEKLVKLKKKQTLNNTETPIYVGRPT